MSEQTPFEEPGVDTEPDGIPIVEVPGDEEPVPEPLEPELPVVVPGEASEEPTGQPEQPGGQIPVEPEPVEPPSKRPIEAKAAKDVAKAVKKAFHDVKKEYRSPPGQEKKVDPVVVVSKQGRVDFYHVEEADNTVKFWDRPHEEGQEPDYVIVNGPAYVVDPDGEFTDEHGKVSYRYDPLMAAAEAIAQDRREHP